LHQHPYTVEEEEHDNNSLRMSFSTGTRTICEENDSMTGDSTTVTGDDIDPDLSTVNNLNEKGCNISM
jgi:hypothetical protein